MDLVGFARRLDELRGSQSVNAFAGKCGLSEGTIRNYIGARTIPRADALMAISSATGARLEWLITGESSAEARLPLPDSGMRPGSGDPALAAAHVEIARLRAELESRNRLVTDLEQEESRLLRRIALEDVRLAKPGSPEAAWRLVSALYTGQMEAMTASRLVSELKDRGIEAALEDVTAELEILVAAGVLSKTAGDVDSVFGLADSMVDVHGDGTVVNQHAREAIRQILRVIVPARSVSRTRGRIVTFVRTVPKGVSEAFLTNLLDQLQGLASEGDTPERDFDRFTMVLGVALDDRLPGGLT